jgi:hypothetical protein
LVSELQKFVLCGLGKTNIQKGLLREFFGLKFDPATSGRRIPIFWTFTLRAPSLVMPKGLLTFGGPKNAQNKDFFMFTKTGSDLKIFGQI